MPWEESLHNILTSYFGDETLEEGINALAAVSILDENYHQACISALQSGIDAAAAGKDDVVNIILDSNAAHVTDLDAASRFLEHLLAEYRARYAYLKSSTASSSSH